MPVSGKIPGALSGATPFKANPSAIAKPSQAKADEVLLNFFEKIARRRAKTGQSQIQPAVLITEGDGPYLESGPDFMSLAAD